MPEVACFLTPAQRELWEDKKRSLEAIKLFMLSELSTSSQQAVCEVGELDDTLEDLRDALRTRTMTNQFRHRNMTGQHALTHGQGFLRQIDIRILKAKLRY